MNLASAQGNQYDWQSWRGEICLPSYSEQDSLKCREGQGLSSPNTCARPTLAFRGSHLNMWQCYLLCFKSSLKRSDINSFGIVSDFSFIIYFICNHFPLLKDDRLSNPLAISHTLCITFRFLGVFQRCAGCVEGHGAWCNISAYVLNLRAKHPTQGLLKASWCVIIHQKH